MEGYYKIALNFSMLYHMKLCVLHQNKINHE